MKKLLRSVGNRAPRPDSRARIFRRTSPRPYNTVMQPAQARRPKIPTAIRRYGRSPGRFLLRSREALCYLSRILRDSMPTEELHQNADRYLMNTYARTPISIVRG